MERRTDLEFGDFPTPPELATASCAALARLRLRPAAIVEPTCGSGSFLAAAAARWPDAVLAGFEIDAAHARRARARCPSARIRRADFFRIDWARELGRLPSPVLVLGNPPWVTSAAIGAVDGANLPAKENADGLGLDAITGRANFDISEWMTWRLLDALGDGGALALLIKASVARRVLSRAWREGLRITSTFHRIDAPRHFGAAVDAGLFVCRRIGRRTAATCRVFDTIDARRAACSIGWRDDRLVADVDAWDRTRHLRATEPTAAWRSGVKHDCTRVLELRDVDGRRVNGLGQPVDVESDLVYPLLKGTDIARGTDRGRWLLVPQRHTGDDPAALRDTVPRTWRYLRRHRDAFARRRSRVYLNRPPFSIFGIGRYTFSRWKVAVSGFHAAPCFRAIGPRNRRPVVFDDTVYFLPCPGRREAERLAACLNGDEAQGFFRARLFSDTKRPVTAGLLGEIDLQRLAGPRP